MSYTTDTRWKLCRIGVDCRAIYDHDYRQVAMMERYSPSEGKGYYSVKMGDVCSPRLKTVTACLNWVKENAK